LGHSPEAISKVCESLKPDRSFFWVHDFFSVCPSYTLLRNGIAFCDAPDIKSLACSVCQYGDERAAHLERFATLFDNIKFEVVAPSKFAADYWQKKSALSATALHIIEHCQLQRPVAEVRRRGGPCRVAYIGHPSSHKGWDTFTLLLREFGQDERYEFHHLGAGPQRDARTVFTRVSVNEQGANAMVEALSQQDIDVAVLWSIWPETFSFVASECLSAGVKIVTSEASGNVVRLVSSNNGGVVFGREEQLLDSFRSGAIAEFAHVERSRRSPLFSNLTFELICKGD
jgi:glycosyltransferase involved in cell wall biosynthesis